MRMKFNWKNLKNIALPTAILVLFVGWALFGNFSGNSPVERVAVELDLSLIPPQFSHESGFYPQEFYLTLSGGAGDVIRFTLDGSEPTPYSTEFVSPIRIYAPAPTLANSPMTVGSRTVPLPMPYYNGMVVRARVFNAENAGSEVVTHSFFVDATFNMRVVSISVHPDDFVGEHGMYRNYNQDIRKPAYVEVFYPDGRFMLSQNAQLRVSGNWSRRERKKSLRLNFRTGDGVVENMSLIPDSAGRFSHITLRTSDIHSTTIREALTDRLGEPLRPETQFSTPAAVFVNGEFWGIYCLREHRNRTFISAHHPGIRESSVVMLEFAWNQENLGYHGVHDFDGPFGPWLDENGVLARSHPLFRVDLEDGRNEAAAYRSWMRMYNAITGGRVYCDSCMEAVIMPANCADCRHGFEMSNPEDFAAAMEFVCFDNLIDFFIVYYHLDNWDWPGNNFITWKTDTVYEGILVGDGRWRFIIHDFDNAFGYVGRNNMNAFTTPHHDMPYYHYYRPLWAVEIWRNLLESEIFRNTLAARYATYMETVFAPARVNHIISELVDERAQDIGRSFHRWGKHGGSLEHSLIPWRNHLEHLLTFSRDRGTHGLNHMREYFNRTDRPHLGLGLPNDTVNIAWQTDPTMGYFNIAGARIHPDLFKRDNMVDTGNFNANYIKGLPIEITAHPLGLYEFSHFEIRSGIRGATKRWEVTDNPIILYPSTMLGYGVTAVFIRPS